MAQARQFTTGIDIGTHAIRLVLSEYISGHAPKIIDSSSVAARGLRHGVIMQPSETATCIRELIAIAENKIKNVKIKRARFSVAGVGIHSQNVHASVAIDAKKGEITKYHIDELVQKSEDIFLQKNPNRKILHVVPIKYRIDGRDILGNPVGTYGQTLELKVLFIGILEHHYEALTETIQQAGLTADDIIAQPLAEAESGLSYGQKTQGVLLLNIGSETTTVSTFENSSITSLRSFSIGSTDITNDIALGLQISLEDAELVKQGRIKDVSKKRVDEIMHARLEDIFELTEMHLRKQGKNRLLPAGVVISGGGALLPDIVDAAKKYLKIPAHSINILNTDHISKKKFTHELFAAAYGLCFDNDVDYHVSGSGILKNIKKLARNVFEQLMP